MLKNGASLTPEAQNALLKTLEELRPDNFIFIGVASTANLLPTIISRCQRISPQITLRLTSQTPINLTLLERLSASKRLSWAEKNLSPQKMTGQDLKEKLFSTLIFYQRRLLKVSQESELIRCKQKLEICLQALSILEANLKPPSVIDWLLLSL